VRSTTLIDHLPVILPFAVLGILLGVENPQGHEKRKARKISQADHMEGMNSPQCIGPEFMQRRLLLRSGEFIVHCPDAF